MRLNVHKYHKAGKMHGEKRLPRSCGNSQSIFQQLLSGEAGGEMDLHCDLLGPFLAVS